MNRKRRFKVLIFCVCLIIITPSAFGGHYADGAKIHYQTDIVGNRLVDDLPASELSDLMEFLNVTNGFWLGIDYITDEPTTHYPDISTGQICSIVATYIINNPEEESQRAGHIILQALFEKWPWYEQAIDKALECSERNK